MRLEDHDIKYTGWQHPIVRLEDCDIKYTRWQHPAVRLEDHDIKYGVTAPCSEARGS